MSWKNVSRTKGQRNLLFLYSSQVKVKQQEVSRDQLLLREVTKLLVTSDVNLVDFGLHLGFGRDEITQMKTNNPNSVETAAWGLACNWWD